MSKAAGLSLITGCSLVSYKRYSGWEGILPHGRIAQSVGLFYSPQPTGLKGSVFVVYCDRLKELLPRREDSFGSYYPRADEKYLPFREREIRRCYSND